MSDMLLTLSNVSSPAGFESAVADIIICELDRLGVKHSETPDGAVLAKLDSGKQSAPRVMLQSHMDEVGFMVRSHKDEGYLTPAPLGITDPKLLTGRRVIINGDAALRGYIGAVPVHLSKGKNIPEYSDLYIHVGALSKEEALRLAPLASYGTFDTRAELFGENLIKGKALASRAPCAVLLDVIRHIKKENIKLPYDLYVAFTTRGELSICGAASVYRRICADKVIAVVGTESGDTPGQPDMICRLGEGVAIPDSEEKYAYDSANVKYLRACADSIGIKTQNSLPIPASIDSDYDLLRLKNTGAELSVIRIPVRYKGSACEVMSLSDIASATELLTSALADMRL